MKKFLIGLTAGLVLGATSATVFWLLQLPGAPAPYSWRFPVSQTPLPESARYSGVGTVGFDLYSNPKAPPVFRRTDPIPATHTSTWGISSGHDGKGSLTETLWIEHDRQLYQVGHFQRDYETQTNRYMNMVKILSVDQARRVTERVIVADLDLDESFGPFPLP